MLSSISKQSKRNKMLLQGVILVPIFKLKASSQKFFRDQHKLFDCKYMYTAAVE